MRRFAMGAGLALLAGCTIEPGTAVPQSVLVQADRLTVRMNDGCPCSGFRDETTETATGWSGTLQGCPSPYRYDVVLNDDTNPVRIVIEEFLTALGGEDILQMRAVVTVDGPEGRQYVFASPN